MADEGKTATTRSRVSRRRFVALAGASLGAATFVAACGGSASAGGGTSEFGDGDVGILNFALTLEHLEAAFFAAALASGLLDGPESETAYKRQTMRKFGEEETEHISALTKAIERLGGEPADAPEAKFPLKTYQAVLTLAGKLENLSAAAYLGQLPRVENPSALATMLSIHSVEGRHAATMNNILLAPITPTGAFAKPAPARIVLDSVEPFIAG
jgi:hypothetical protein